MLACGVDFIRIERIENALHRFGERFLNKVFTPEEQARYAQKPSSLAARWAAKEAVGKALGCGIGDVMWKEIEVLTDARGAPVLHLHGDAAALAQERQLHQWAISISHDDGRAIAFVVAMG